jgi:FkbM family methyltransferase
MLPPALRRPLIRWRRRACEAVGIRRYSRPALDGLDCKLERHLNFDRGFFIEAGAHDGVQQSNTYYLERFRGWRGILVEGIPAQAAECRLNRPQATVIQAALVAAAQAGDVVGMHFGGLMSAVQGSLGDASATEAHVQAGLAVQNLASSYVVQVPARTLTMVLDEVRPAQEIDLLSLDVEGMEAEVLRGLDLTRYAPRSICVEMREGSEVGEVLGGRYRLAEVLVDHGTRRDVLYQRT